MRKDHEFEAKNARQVEEMKRKVEREMKQSDFKLDSKEEREHQKQPKARK